MTFLEPAYGQRSLGDVVPAVGAALGLPLRPSLGEVGLELPAQPIYLDADPVRLAQVFTNLLNNACKYTEPGGRIRLSAELAGGDVVVKVSDTGLGIPPEQLASIFNAGQADRTNAEIPGFSSSPRKLSLRFRTERPRHIGGHRRASGRAFIFAATGRKQGTGG